MIFFFLSNDSFFFQFLFSAPASRCWSECSCNWEPIGSACAEKVRLSEVSNELPEEERKGLLWQRAGRFLSCVSMASRAEAPTAGPLWHSSPVTWFHRHPCGFWIWGILPSLVADGTIRQMDSVVVLVLQCATGLDFWLLELSWISAVFWSERPVVGTFMRLRLLWAYPDRWFLPVPVCV